MRLGMVTTYPPGTGSLNEYAFHFVNAFRGKPEVAELILLVDELPLGKAYEPTPPHQAPTAEPTTTAATSATSQHTWQAQLRFKPCWRFNSRLNLWHLLRAAQQAKPDIVLFNIQFASFGSQKIPATLGLLTPALLRFCGIPTVVLLHNIMETVDLQQAGFAKHPWMERLMRSAGWLVTKLLLQANLVAVTIPKYVEILEKRYGATNVLLAPHGSFETAATAPSFELPAGPLRIMTFGKFGTYKRVETLVEAFALLQSQRQAPLELVIAGTDSPNAPSYLANVAQQYAQVPNVRYTGYVAEQDVPQLFTEAAAVVFPYTSTTGSSGVLHQAGDYGKAVVLPNIGDLAELVAEEGYTGEFFEPNNPQSLADAIARLLDEPERRLEMAQQNYLAARGLPLGDVVDWYLLHMESLLAKQ
ncbi:MAG: glycosyltransferase [Caldilineaceae bacterium]|nr:glycosyltransferase [Caldilineaceae bacterium]